MDPNKPMEIYEGVEKSLNLDLRLLFDAWKKFQTYSPKWCAMMVMNPMVQSVKITLKKSKRITLNLRCCEQS